MTEKKSESKILNLVRLDAARRGIHLFRNNVGCMYDPEKNVYVRFGLMNDSKKLNDKIKSADLIGIKPVLITPDMVGTIIGQFVSREIKAEGWKFKGTERENAQIAWMNLINKNGGDAAITSDEEL